MWGHFCLCYKHFKLINDKSHIKHFGIRDGEQVHLVNIGLIYSSLSVVYDVESGLVFAQVINQLYVSPCSCIL